MLNRFTQIGFFPLLLLMRTEMGYAEKPISIDAERVLFGDVVPQASPPLALLDIGDSPAPGQKRVYVESELRQRAEAAQLPVGSLHLPRRQVVIRRGQTLTEFDLLGLFENSLRTTLPNHFTVQSVRLAGGVVLPRGKIAIAVSENVPWRQGRQSVAADIFVNGALFRRMMALVTLDTQKQSDALRVQRGEQLRLRLRCGAATIYSSAVAQESGSVGQTIRVLPQNGTRVIEARLQNDGTGEIEL